ncbi:MAG TPA: hypothetical protein VFF73_06895 [Planctomycetota bacterium]|nr:hypothetical protein [Planctomycetota bacterium]
MEPLFVPRVQFQGNVWEQLRLEIGYMNRYLGPNCGVLANRMQHYLVVGLKVTFR